MVVYIYKGCVTISVWRFLYSTAALYISSVLNNWLCKYFSQIYQLYKALITTTHEIPVPCVASYNGIKDIVSHFLALYVINKNKTYSIMMVAQLSLEQEYWIWEQRLERMCNKTYLFAKGSWGQLMQELLPAKSILISGCFLTAVCGHEGVRFS